MSSDRAEGRYRMTRYDDFNYTDRARTAVEQAKKLKAERGHGSIGAAHIFLSLDEEGVAAAALKILDKDLGKLKREFETSQSYGEEECGPVVPFSNTAGQVLDRAVEEQRSMYHKYLGDEHLIVALIQVPSQVSQFLTARGLTAADAREQVLDLLGAGVEEDDGQT